MTAVTGTKEQAMMQEKETHTNANFEEERTGKGGDHQEIPKAAYIDRFTGRKIPATRRKRT